MKKALSLFLALVMVIGMIPVMATVASAEAEDIIADPTTSKTVEINSAADFIALLGTTAENTTYILKADIDLSTDGVAKMITAANPITLKNSVFDGNGKTIKGFTVDSNNVGSGAPVGSQNWIGLFKTDATAGNTAVIQDLKLGSDTEKINIVNKNWGVASGAVIGAVTAGTKCKIKNVDVYVNYTHTGQNGGKICGGLVGHNAGALEIDGCTSNGYIYSVVTDDGNKRGYAGMVGWVTDTATGTHIKNSTNNATVSSIMQVGGMVGYAQGPVAIDNCTNTGALSATADNTKVGGMVGYATANVTVLNCENNGEISGPKQLGGIVGVISGANLTAKISDCTNTAKMTGNTCGGIVGEISNVKSAEITKCTNTGNINDVAEVPASYTHCAGILAWRNGNVSISGCNNSGNVKAINTAGGIVGHNLSSATITGCINSGAITATTSDKNWHGTGGIVGYTDSDVTIQTCINDGAVTTKGYAGGAIGSCFNQNATRALNFTGFKNTGNVNSESKSAGGFISYAKATVTVTNSANSGNVTSSGNNVGGFVGEATATVNVTNSVNSGNVTGAASVGGFIGYTAASATVTSSSNSGDVTGTESAGGFIGKTAATVEVTNSVNSGDATGTGNFIAGFVGYTTAGVTVSSSANSGNITGNGCLGGFVGTTSASVTVTNSANSGNVTGTSWEIGGLVGKTTSSTTIKDSVNSGSIKGVGAIGGFIGNVATAGTTTTIQSGEMKKGNMNKGNVVATSNGAGGAIGQASLMSGTINVSDFFNAGNVTSDSSSGGVLGISEPGKENGVEKDNSALKITIDRLVNTGTIIGKWRGCAATGYIQKSTVTINNSISTGKTQYYGNTSPRYYADSLAFADNGDNKGNVTGSGNYYANGKTLGEGFGETKGTISDILAILNAENSPYVHGPYASNYNEGNANNIVLATPEFEGYQTGTTVTDNKVKIRLLATIDDVNLLEGSCEYTYLGFKITVDGTVVEGKIEGGEVIWSSQQFVYTSILANEGGKEVTYTAEQFGGKYIYAEVLELDATKAHTIYVQTFASNKKIDNPEEKDLYFGGTYTINIPVVVSAN